MIGENAMKDSELIQKVHSGNKEAVGIIIKRYYADICTKFGRWYTKWDGMRIVQIKIGYSKEKMMPKSSWYPYQRGYWYGYESIWIGVPFHYGENQWWKTLHNSGNE